MAVAMTPREPERTDPAGPADEWRTDEPRTDEPRTDQPLPDELGPDHAVLAEATRTFSAHAEARWVEIVDRVRARAMLTTRRSLPVRAQAPGGAVHVSEQVLVSYLRDAVAGVPDTEVRDVVLATQGRDTCTGVTVVISARYGTSLLPVADTLRALAAQRLGELLGATAPLGGRTMHVHVDDVHEDA